MTLTEAGEPSELAIKLLNVEGAAQLRCRLSRTHDQTFREWQVQRVLEV